MELLPITANSLSSRQYNSIIQIEKPQFEQKAFVEANTIEIDQEHLYKDCIIPVFAKDNEKTIAHQEFIAAAQECVASIYSNHIIDIPEIRVSHAIKGRIPEAIHKPAKELLDHEKTTYYDRMTFIIRIPTILENINGNNLALTIGGVRAYNQQNLYAKKGIEKFKFFIGFQNLVCCNLCVSTDGYIDEVRVSSIEELQDKIFSLVSAYNTEKHLESMYQLTQSSLSEHQFAQFLGKARLYNYLPKEELKNVPKLLLNDNQISAVAKDYFKDENFSRNPNGDISLWNVYNLLTGANKNSYIDTFLARGANAFKFADGLADNSSASNYHWFLN